MPEPFIGPLPRLRGTQIGFSNPGQIDVFKQEMLQGRYLYDFVLGKINGVIDPRGVYHIKGGHHRMAAALEILKESGDDRFVRLLLSWGLWQRVIDPPTDSCPMPARTWWGWFWNRYGH